MRMTTARHAVSLAAIAAATAAILVAAGDADAGRRSAPRPARYKAEPAVVSRLETPLGLQGVASAGAGVVFPFVLNADVVRAPTEIEAQYGVDRNGDGATTEDEYFAATEDRLDPRDTRRDAAPQLFPTSGDIGAANAFVWLSTADLGSGRYLMALRKFTDAGRLIPDPAHPGDFLYDDAQAGARLRLRAVRGHGRKRQVGDWAYTDPFPLDNSSAPSVTIDAARPFASGAGPRDRVEIQWTAYDRDSEDRSGDGVFDPGEDRNGNRSFDQQRVGVAFDFHRVLPGEDPAAIRPWDLDELLWEPCTRAAGEGDTDSFRESDRAKAIYGAPFGRSWTFVWDAGADLGASRPVIVLRARAIDQSKSLGEWTYDLTPFAMDD